MPPGHHSVLGEVLAALAGLKRLTIPSLASCEQVSDLRPLAGLKWLTTLYLFFCPQVSDLSL